MKTSNLKTKKKYGGWVKYFIFNLILFGVLFALQMNGGEKAKAADPVITLHASNHSGKDLNNQDVSKNAVNAETKYGIAASKEFYDTWYIQGVGIHMKDVVVVEIETDYKVINGLVVFESGYTSSTANGKNYDSYKKIDGAWESLSDNNFKTVSGSSTTYSGLAPGKVVASASNVVATSTDLEANGGTVYSLLYITEVSDGKITIKYAYTIRNAGYGIKELNFVIYNDDGYTGDAWNDPEVATTITVEFTVAKPISENNFTWVNNADVNATGGKCLTNSSAAGRPTTDNICVTYINGTTVNSAKLLKITLPKETAYYHNVVVDDDNDPTNTFDYNHHDKVIINTIKDNTIYGTNTFTNAGSATGMKVIYYYYDFKLVDSVSGNSTSGNGNTQMNPFSEYVISLSVDASGEYEFTITDIFGNVYKNSISNNEGVKVEDVLITNILVDYTNAPELTIMEATGAYEDGSYKKNWIFTIDATKIDFKKIKQDEVQVIAFVFQKLVINNGEFAGNGTAGATTTGGSSTLEDIAKQPLGANDRQSPNDAPNKISTNETRVWRIKDLSETGGKSVDDNGTVSCETDLHFTDVCGTTAETDISYSIDDNYSAGRSNKLTFTITSNGRYRILIVDTFNNTTDNLTGALQNPSVEISVIDRVAPVISSGLADAKNSINTYPYVIGGGEVSVEYPGAWNTLDVADKYWNTASSYDAIYYNEAGSKMFNYQDALEIAKIRVVDQVYYFSGSSIDAVFANYSVNFGSYESGNGIKCFSYSSSWSSNDMTNGQYCDPSSSLKSDRNTSGTSYNLHNYIITENLTSFTAGLVRQVDATSYDSTNSYSKVTGSTTGLTYVNADNATSFVGYLKIEFKDSADQSICFATLDSAQASGESNQACFNLMNKYIDEVENFKMVFTAYDYAYDTTTNVHTIGHKSNDFVVEVTVMDTTAPGISMTGADDNNRIEYSNDDTTCRLEIDNDIQFKANILECYKIKDATGYDGSGYNFRDNNVDHEDSTVKLNAGKQFYKAGGNSTSANHYYKKIKLYVKKKDSTVASPDWQEIIGEEETGSKTIPHLYKSGYHEIKIEIYDHWGSESGLTGVTTTDNLLTIYGAYYVNPRTLLIEPLVNEKMYGENDPTFDYCVYVNRSNETFYYEDNFFDTTFIDEHFVYIYCTKNVFVDVTGKELYGRTAATTHEDGYSYRGYSTSSDNDKRFIKVNNTYVPISGKIGAGLYETDVLRYNEDGYVAHANGEYHKSNDKYYEIKSGYLYADDACRNAYMGSGDSYLKFMVDGASSFSCEKVTTKYTKKYKVQEGGKFIRYNINDVCLDGAKTCTGTNVSLTTADRGNANIALVNEAATFQGSLARVESKCYNNFPTSIDQVGDYHSNTKSTNFATYLTCNENSIGTGEVRNDNVGQYRIVLGTLSVSEITGQTGNDDYVIKINTNYRAEKLSLSTSTNQPFTIKHDGVITDDGLKTESTVLFTIRQAVLTVTANGYSKKYGEQDPYSHNWNVTITPTNITRTGVTNNGYLGGYSVHGWRVNGEVNDANLVGDTSKYIISGVLRRQKGEHVGVYDICNINATPIEEALASTCDSTAPGLYNSSTIYYYSAFDRYALDGSSTTAALTIRTNANIYGSATGRTLNTDTRNYAINYIEADFTIHSTDLIIQPGINQGKEFASSEYNDPLWQLVIFGEKGAFANADSGFNGYTATIAADTFTQAKINEAPYTNNTDRTKDTEVYYARRKSAPTNVDYYYVINITLSNYTKYKLDNGYYVEDSTLAYGATTYVYAYGEYRPTDGASSGTLKIEIEGNLVTQNYTLFVDGFKNPLADTSYPTRESGKDVKWYTYNSFDDEVIKLNGNTTCGDGDDACQDYTVTFKDEAPTPYNADGNTNTTIAKPAVVYKTDSTVSAVEYKPDGINGCFSTGEYSAKCEEADKNKITFEIFKREIIIGFIDDNYTFIYGERYEYYKDNIFAITSTNTTTKERDVFLCYSDLGDYLVDCTNDTDYGTTAGDSWYSIGLEFHMYTTISGFSRTGDTVTHSVTQYYSSHASNKALPAGEYFVYASINDTATQNYKFTYLGGTLLIKPKVTNIQLTSYTMEYADPHYSSYGLGTKYSDFTVTSATCMLDSYYTNGDTNLITGCTEVGNVVGNTYGFVIEGLDVNDTIAKNFVGRPQRNSTAGDTGYVDVGWYKISVNDTIKSIKDGDVSFKSCASDSANKEGSGCIFASENDGTSGSEVVGNNGVNYDITYSRDNNEGAYLFVLPANMTITVDPNQTKMYGCAYHDVHFLSETNYYTYTYDNGYSNCDKKANGDQETYDAAYKYTVYGDKDSATTQGTTSSYVVTNSRGTLSYSSLSGTTTVKTEVFNNGNLYRVTYAAGIDHSEARSDADNGYYQGQKVGVYTISLGNLDAANNKNTQMCDAYNNPVLEGGMQCRNYNINYYGENAVGKNDVDDTSNDTHHYVAKKDSVSLDNLKLYSLNYVVAADGKYILINGKFMDVERMPKYNSTGGSGTTHVLINNYVLASTLQKYSKYIAYEKDVNGEYVYIDLTNDNTDNGSYALISSLTKYKKNGDGTYSEDGSVSIGDAYVPINGNYIKLSSLTRFKRNYDPASINSSNEGNMYKADSTGTYVLINGKYVQLASLNKYKLDNGLYTKDASGTYVEIYEYVELSSITRYSLAVTSTNMFANNGSDTTKNLFVFVNGSYIPYSSVDVNNVYDAAFVSDMADTYSVDVKFTITARMVYVHPEYNVKAYGENDVKEEISCANIKLAYLDNSYDWANRSYCSSAADAKIVLGSSMYYAMENSLAKYPFTEWVDDVLNGVPADASIQKRYNDIQFDVVKGEVDRARILEEDKERAGKYSYDFANVATNDEYSGNNYLIHYVVKGNDSSNASGIYNYNSTYVQTTSGFKTLSEVLYDRTNYCAPGSYHCVIDSDALDNGTKGKTLKANGYKLYVDADGKVAESGTLTSVSLIKKYSSASTANLLSYWYLGFYKVDNNDGRTGELSKWWTNADEFKENYDDFRMKNDSASIASGSVANGDAVYTYFTTAVAREVYFEIIKRTIYLYAVDTQKIYGEADKYSDFLVAICAHNRGYEVTNDGIKCKAVDASDIPYGYGLSVVDKGIFTNTSTGIMNQWQIKNNGTSVDYLFGGASNITQSFGIYFRRQTGEDAGSYMVTACATQDGIPDCTHEAKRSSPNYTINNVADNYNILEIPGLLTINTRTIDLTPDANQGFQYGNYTENGSMPNITFTETHGTGASKEGGLANGGKMWLVKDGNYVAEIIRNAGLYTFTLSATTYTINGVRVYDSSNNYVGSINVTGSTSNTKTLTIDSNTYDIVQTASCLIDISGLSIICINDAQNEALAGIGFSASTTKDNLTIALKDKLYVYAAAYSEAALNQVLATAPVSYMSKDVYGDEYSNPLNANSRKESEYISGSKTRSALSLTCNGSEARYSREVCNYAIVAGELDANSEFNASSRDIYVYVTEARRYTRSGSEGSYTYTGDVNGTWINYGPGLYAEYNANQMYAYVCTTTTSGSDTIVNCEYKKLEGDAAVENRYLKISTNDMNYIIATFTEGEFVVTQAGLDVTPVEKQHKVYGEADIELKFTVETTYTVADTHFQNFANSNIVKLCNGMSCVTTFTDYLYNISGSAITKNSAGTYILLTKGWTVTLNSYAYDEENATNKASNMDYGNNFDSIKFASDGYKDSEYGTADAADDKIYTNSNSVGATIKHYDKYTTYNSSITTSRVLTGNLYVKDYAQTAGEHDIVSGMGVSNNTFGNKNYSYSQDATNDKDIEFVIVPRPVNVQIQNITKIYGQATDKESCDASFAGECIVGDGILIKDDNDGVEGIGPNEDENKSLLINNYNILTISTTGILGGASNITQDLETASYTGANKITISYPSSAVNMPTVVSVAFADGNEYKSYVSVSTGKFYTADTNGAQERKNDTLNISVERGKTNIANANACYVLGETYCEDAGEYYLNFNSRVSGMSAESTVTNAYYGKYWGYNPNYYVIIYNNYEASGWTTDDGFINLDSDTLAKDETINTTINTGVPSESATLKIRRRSIQMVVETVITYEEDNTGTTHLKVNVAESGQPENIKYYLILDTNRYNLVDSKYVHSKTGEYLYTGSAYLKISEYVKVGLKSTTVGEKYNIEQNMDVPQLPKIDNSTSTHHTTYDTTNYKNITWYEHPRQVRLADELFGEVAYCQTQFDITSTLDTLRYSKNCSEGDLRYYTDNINNVNDTTGEFFDSSEEGFYIITREKDRMYIRNTTNSTNVSNGDYEKNNYITEFVNGLLQIDKDETAPVINIETDFIIKEANASELAFLNDLRTNQCANLEATRNASGGLNNCGNTFTFEDGSNSSEVESPNTSISYGDMMTLIRWFGLSSFDPSIMRAGQALGKRYDARWYMAIQYDFNQRKVGDYTLFIYVQDNVGNISLASTSTLRIVDTSSPEVGTLNLYNGAVECIVTGTVSCSDESSWFVKEDIYLPIHTLTADNLAAMKVEDKATKYSFVGKASDGTYSASSFRADNHFGTYYKITAGTPAAAIKHSGWSNAYNGIYMTITGGSDNSLTYLDTSVYTTKYTKNGNEINIASSNGTHLLLGSFINLNTLTKYRRFSVNGCASVSGGVKGCDEVSSGGSNTVFMPIVGGTIIRYRGYYYDYSAHKYYNHDGSEATTVATQHQVNLYEFDETNNKYIPATTINPDNKYFVRDGELYEIPGVKYNADGQHDASGKYINFAQWDQYYSRDGGKSWIKYSRDATSGYLVLGQDGQRLIMIKAIDNGYTFASADVNKNHMLEAYCTKTEDATKGKCEWNEVGIGDVTIKDASSNDISYKEYKGEKVMRYNISAWEEYNASGNRDRKYAYLDTIIPDVTLNDQFIEVFEYGCADISKCSTNHLELFGTARDGYVFKLANLTKYNSSGTPTLGGTHVVINGQLMAIDSIRRYNLDGNTLTQASDGDYIYLGKTDSAIAADKMNEYLNLTGHAVDLTNLLITNTDDFVYDEHAKAGVKLTIAKPLNSTSEDSVNLQANTKYIQSGLGSGEKEVDSQKVLDLFSGTGNSDLSFGVSSPAINDKYTNIFVYVHIGGGTGAVSGNPYYNKGLGYYKFMISEKSEGTYKIYGCFYGNTVPDQYSWCSSGDSGYIGESSASFTTYKLAMEELLAVYKAANDGSNAYNFNGNDLTFTLDYRVFDIAGNASYYQRKGIIFSGFTRTIGVDNGAGAAVSALSVEVAQNADISSTLSKYAVVTTTGKSLRNSERILQTVYYNGVLVSSRSEYDINSLSTLDTSVPGNYRIVYTIERRDGVEYVQGNTVELMVTVKPNVANVAIDNINYTPVVITLAAIITTCLAMLFIELKKKQKN